MTQDLKEYGEEWYEAPESPKRTRISEIAILRIEDARE